MSKMRVVGVKLTQDPHSTKVAYYKGDKLYIRTGKDNFRVGNEVTHDKVSLYTKWGFRKVDNPPILMDAQGIIDNLPKFHLSQSGSITYSG